MFELTMPDLYNEFLIIPFHSLSIFMLLRIRFVLLLNVSNATIVPASKRLLQVSQRNVIYLPFPFGSLKN